MYQHRIKLVDGDGCSSVCMNECPAGYFMDSSYGGCVRDFLGGSIHPLAVDPQCIDADIVYSGPEGDDDFGPRTFTLTKNKINETTLTYDNPGLGISFEYQENWIIEVEQDLDCNPFEDLEIYCIKVFNEPKTSWVDIRYQLKSSTFNFGDGIGGLMSEEYYRNSRKFILNDRIEIVRPNFINGVQSYFGNYLINLQQITIRLDEPNVTEYGVFLGNISNWIVSENDQVAFSIGYLIDPNSLENTTNIDQNILVQEMDEIVASINIKFTANPFE